MQISTFWMKVERISLAGEADVMPSCLPESPLLRRHDPKAEREVRCRVREDTGSEAFRAISHEVVECAGDERGGPIGARECERQKARVTPAKESQLKAPNGTFSKSSAMR